MRQERRGRRPAALSRGGLGGSAKAPAEKSACEVRALHQVLEYLYVGSWAASTATAACRSTRSVVYSSSPQTPRTLPAFVTHHLHVVCRDDENAPLGTAFPQIAAFLDEAKRAREIAYVHCGAGVSRACTSVAAYLIWSGSLSAGEALRIVQNRRPQCRPNAGFKKQLGAWAGRCRGGEKPAICAASSQGRRRGTVVTVVRCDMSE